MIMGVQGIRAEPLAEKTTAYWVSVEGCDRELRFEVDESSKVRLVRGVDDAAAFVGRTAAPLIARLILRYHDKEAVALPHDIDF